MNVLLGALHEELNVRRSKPYIENPESLEDNEQLIHLYWSNFLRRNWSFILFLYYGQLRSTLICTACQKKRVKYEPFSNLSLPIPDSNSIMLTIMVVCLPPEIR